MLTKDFKILPEDSQIGMPSLKLQQASDLSYSTKLPGTLTS